MPSLLFPPSPGLTMLHNTSVQSLSCVWFFATPWTAAHQPFLSISNFQSLLKLMSIDSIQPSHPLSFPFSSHLQSFPALGSFQISRFFTSGSQSFSFSISPSNEYSGLISFRMNWLDLFAVQGTLKTTVQKHQFFGTQLSVQLSHPYMTTGKTVALTRWTKPWASDNGTVPLTSDFYQDSTYGALI